jgi:hypothetical protein
MKTLTKAMQKLSVIPVVLIGLTATLVLVSKLVH